MDDREEIELYKKHKKETEQQTLMNMTNIFDIEDMVYAVVWKLICNTHGKEDIIPRDKRREYIHEIIDREIDKWME